MTQAKEIYKNRVKTCLWCEKDYKVFPYEFKVSKYCSKSCHGKSVMTGRKHNSESIEKMRLSKVGKSPSIETRKKISITLARKHKNGEIVTAFSTGHKAYPLSKKGREKQIASVTGSRNSNWKGGTMKWARQQVRLRDDYICQICGLRDPEIMEVDHIKPLRKKSRYGYADDMENMQTLCPNCHRRKTNSFLKEIYTGKLLPTKKYV